MKKKKKSNVEMMKILPFSPSPSVMDEQLWDAVFDGRTEEVESLLKAHPALNVNLKDEKYGYQDWAPLHHASNQSHLEIVKLLLAHPAIDVNVKNRVGSTPILIACEQKRVAVVQLLLKDPRVDATLADQKDCTPLWWASRYGHVGLVEWLIVSGRDLGDLDRKGREWDDIQYSAREIARAMKKTSVASLLERFMADPMQTRHEVRVKLGVLDELAAEVFALAVFLCDDLLQLKGIFTIKPAAAAAVCFFAVAKRLPMELQMILCHLAVGSRKQNILHKDSEAAFKSLARILLPLPSHLE